MSFNSWLQGSLGNNDLDSYAQDIWNGANSFADLFETNDNFDTTESLIPIGGSQASQAEAGAEELDKEQSIALLKLSFKNLIACKATNREIAYVQKVQDIDLDEWCRELYKWSWKRIKKGSSTLKPRRKRSNCKNSPEYETCTARVRAIANILMIDKRACVRFRSELSWPQRLADDPIYERDTIHLNDNGNTDKARRFQQSKEYGASIVKEVQALKQALVDGAEEVDMGMLINKLDSIETLATYVKDRAAADKVAAGRTGKHRAKRSNNSREESLEVLPADWEQGEMSPYTTQATPSFMSPQLRSAYLEDTTPKKRKLDNGRSAM